MEERIALHFHKSLEFSKQTARHSDLFSETIVYTKIAILFFCVAGVFAAKSFWPAKQIDNSAESNPSNISPLEESPESNSAPTIAPQSNSIPNSLTLARKLRLLERGAENGDLTPLVEFIEDELDRTTDPKTQKQLTSALTNAVFKQPGDRASTYLESFADRNRTDAVVINERVWMFVDRARTETIPPKILNSLGYAIEIAIAADPSWPNAWDTQSNLYEISGELDNAIAAAKKATELSAAESPNSQAKREYERHLSQLLKKQESAGQDN